MKKKSHNKKTKKLKANLVDYISILTIMFVSFSGATMRLIEYLPTTKSSFIRISLPIILIMGMISLYWITFRIIRAYQEY